MTQEEAFDILKLGHNVFLTGPAGSGKTHLLNRYMGYLAGHEVPVAVTASTGIAATHLGGQTIHSWSGIGVRESINDKELAELATKARIRRNWRRAKVLVIDEISMLHARQLDMIDRLGRHILNGDKPFGGLQVVLCGDFFQLPPISGKSPRPRLPELIPGINFGDSTDTDANEKVFAYESPAWERGAFKVCYLHEQFRQKSDELFAVLSNIRNGAGHLARASLQTRHNKELKEAARQDIRPTRLYSHNINVDAVNERELNKIPGKVKSFHMKTRGFKALADNLKRSCLAPEILKLKVGAEVMFVKNAQNGRYVNGTRGTVKGFTKMEMENWPLVRTLDGRLITAEPEEWRFEENGVVRASLTQVPLRLAWAITIHKSQGMTLDAAEMDLSDAFEPGMGYVALSRVRSMNGLKLMGLNNTALLVHPKILAHDKKLRQWSGQAREPLLQYSQTQKEAAFAQTLLERFGGSKTKTTPSGSGQKRPPKARRETKTPTHEITRQFLEQRQSVAAIARERKLAISTILGHMEKLKGLGALPDVSYLKNSVDGFNAILAEFKKSEDGRLSPVFERFGGKHSFETLRLVRLFAN